MSDFNIINAHANAVEKLSDAWARLFQNAFDVTPKRPEPVADQPAPRRLLLPDGQTVNPDDVRDLYTQTEPHAVNFNTRDGLSGYVPCANADEANRLCRWMLEQCGITVVSFPAGEDA